MNRNPDPADAPTRYVMNSDVFELLRHERPKKLGDSGFFATDGSAAAGDEAPDTSRMPESSIRPSTQRS